MQFTITAQDVRDFILILVSILNTAVCIHFFIKSSKLRRSRQEFRKSWMHLHDGMKHMARERLLFDNAVKAHVEAVPGDLRCAIYFSQSKTGLQMSAYHQQEICNLTTWAEGPGKDIVTMLADGLQRVERQQAGIIPILQVMLDERRDALRQEKAAKL